VEVGVGYRKHRSPSPSSVWHTAPMPRDFAELQKLLQEAVLKLTQLKTPRSVAPC
jgi:hypothetical protein